MLYRLSQKVLKGKNALAYYARAFAHESILRNVHYLHVSSSLSSRNFRYNISFSLELMNGPNELECCITLGWKGLSITNTLAYCAHSEHTSLLCPIKTHYLIVPSQNTLPYYAHSEHTSLLCPFRTHYLIVPIQNTLAYYGHSEHTTLLYPFRTR